MEIVDLYRGNGDSFEFLAVESDEVTPIVLTDNYSNILIEVIHNDTRKTIKYISWYPYTDPDGNVYDTDDFVVQDDAQGDYLFNVQPSVLETADKGLYIAKMTTWEINSDFESGYKPKSVEFDLFNLL